MNETRWYRDRETWRLIARGYLPPLLQWLVVPPLALYFARRTVQRANQDEKDRD